MYITADKSQSGQINLKKALNVDYDSAYLFVECTTNRDIEMILGIPYQKKTYIQDSECKLILIKNNKIVYEDLFYCKAIEFFFYHDKYYYKKNDIEYIMWTDSIFAATSKQGLHGDVFFQLRPINDFCPSY